MASEMVPDELMDQTGSDWISVDDSGANTPKDIMDREVEVQTTIKQDQEIDFVTLGMFIIDEIEYMPPRPTEVDVLGGAGSFSALGARLFSPGPVESKTVGWIVDQGSDFPPTITSLIDSWQTSALLRHDPARLTTRGWNGYIDDQGTRAFKYTTPKKRLTVADLSGTPLLQSKAFHMVCSADRCRELVGDILALRKAEAPPYNDEDGSGGYTKPVIVWEPVPDLCTPDELLKLTNCLPLVDVLSPNHSELAAFMGDTGLDDTGAISTAAVERACEQLLGSMPLSSFTLVIRAGAKGCYLARNGAASKTKTSAGNTKRRKAALGARGTLQPDTDMMSLFAGLLQQETTTSTTGEDDDANADGAGEPTFSFIRDDFADDAAESAIDPGLDKWLPAYWTDETEKTEADTSNNNGGEGGEQGQHQRVVDPTGGGNTFLGALAVALARGRSMEEAASWGSVAASFAIEQVGVPTLRYDATTPNENADEGDGGGETWNGVRVQDRLAEYYERIGLTPAPAAAV